MGKLAAPSNLNKEAYKFVVQALEKNMVEKFCYNFKNAYKYCASQDYEVVGNYCY